MAKRIALETDKRLLARLAINFGWKGMRSIQRFKKRIRHGQYFPPFLYISLINSCNLKCQGCWVDVTAKKQTIPADNFHRMIREAVEMGNSFFGILGGEPFVHKELLDLLEPHQDCYFQIFTNGQLITREHAQRMRTLGNITPLVSVEGNEIVSNERRGKDNVLSRTLDGLQHCLDAKLITGVCTSLCKTNIDDLLTETWVDRLIEMGALYMWYHTYRPVGPDPNEQLALSPEEQLRVRKFVVDMRVKKPIGIIDAYYDHDGKALCPAATGISHHISPWGDIEPCPIIQFGREKIDDKRGIAKTMMESEYLRDFRQTAAKATRGCIVLERPDLLKALVERHNAKDDTARRTAMRELEAMNPRPSQYNRMEQVPEKNWVYRFAKKHFFNDFNAYEHLDPPSRLN